jgi:arylsulfatase A-like enzyme
MNKEMAAALVIGISYAFLASVATAADARRPNILIILADDLGYGELSCQGNPQIPTPNVDSIARNGVRFTSGYVSGPYCNRTRATLLTGRYQQRFGHEFNPGLGRGPNALQSRDGHRREKRSRGEEFREGPRARG